MKQYVEVKVGDYNGNLGDLLKERLPEFKRTGPSMRSVPYICMNSVGGMMYTSLISQNLDPSTSTNIVVTVNGPEKKVVKQKLEVIADKTKIKLSKAPKKIEYMMGGIASMLSQYYAGIN